MQTLQSIHSDWYELTKGRPFIVDLGFDPQAMVPTEDGEQRKLARYAAFCPVPKEKRHKIVEVCDDLAQLAGKYSVPEDFIFKIGAACRG